MTFLVSDYVTLFKLFTFKKKQCNPPISVCHPKIFIPNVGVQELLLSSLSVQCKKFFSSRREVQGTYI